jgi:ATP-binding cassette subfamily B multidrug efflux pump
MIQASSEKLNSPWPLIRDVLFSRPAWRILILFTSLAAATLGLVAAGFQKAFIDILTSPTWSLQKEFNQQPLSFLLWSFLCFVISSLLTQLNLYWGTLESLRAQQKLAQQVYDQALALKSETLAKKTVGEMVALYATDVPAATVLLEQTLPYGASTFFPLFLTPVALSFLIGTPLLETFLLVVIVALLNSLLALRQSRFFFKFKELAAARTALVNEWIQNIRTLKILNWMAPFEARIFEVREAETKNRVAMVTNGQMMNAITSHSTFLFNVVAVLSLILIYKRTLTPGEIWTVFWILGILLNRPLRQLPWFFTFAFDALTSARRLQSFLTLRSFSESWPKATGRAPTGLEISSAQEGGSPGPLLEIQGLTWEQGGEKILADLDFKIHPKEKVAILGEVGTGKTAFLLSLMGELNAQFEKFFFNGRPISEGSNSQDFRRMINYVPQESFLMNSTLRDNLVFEYEKSSLADPDLDHFLKSVDFDPSFEGLTEGLNTRIGERGVNLSGGQKQRLSLARSMAQDRPFVFIDDSMSQLDSQTEIKILQELFSGALKKKTVIMTTHRRSALKFVDKVYELKAGQLREIPRTEALENHP